jgi:cell fate regulator YaaT (PSP1 superfamily)
MSDETSSPRRPDADRRRRGGDRAFRSQLRRRDPGREGDGRGPEPPRAGEELAVLVFKGNRKSYYHNRRGLEVQVGDHCLVDADRGRDLGRIVYLGEGQAIWWDEAIHQGLLAPARDQDVARLAELRSEEREAWDVGLQKIHDHELDMQLVGVERRWDRGKLTFYFLAPGRVDFRALVRDLAGVFRTRIELRQIGVRDEAKLKGGLGVCGREFCCSRFLTSFESVTLRMAKDQQLPLNPAKLSGPCGRLRCCLAFENQQYREILREMPRLGSEVTSGGRRGRARKLDPLQGRVSVEWDGDGRELVDVPLDELQITRAAIGPATDAGDDENPGERGRRRRGRRGRGRRDGPGDGS